MNTADLNLEKKSLNELLKIKEELENFIIEKKGNEKQELIEMIWDLVTESDFSMKDITDELNKKKKMKAKYQNPDNKKETWAGQGRKPKWIKKKETSGIALDSLII